MDDKKNDITFLDTPPASEWKCYLFGTDGDWGIVWHPRKGQHPNWFWRKMQFLCFGNRWKKETP
jgi:hypothetical protein